MKIRSKIHQKEWYSTGYYSIFQMFRIGFASPKHPFRLHERGAFTKKGGTANAATRPFLIWYTAINSGERYEKRQATKCDNKGIALRLPWMGLLYFLINIGKVSRHQSAYYSQENIKRNALQ